MLKNITESKKTTAAAIVVILVWLLPQFIPGLKIPPQVQVAATSLIGSIILLISKDHDK